MVAGRAPPLAPISPAMPLPPGFVLVVDPSPDGVESFLDLVARLGVRRPG